MMTLNLAGKLIMVTRVRVNNALVDVDDPKERARECPIEGCGIRQPWEGAGTCSLPSVYTTM